MPENKNLNKEIQ